jgi:hypothetical protein
MTDEGMTFTGCVPLPGQDLVARQGDLAVVAEDAGPGDDPLLAALGAVGAARGDGVALVLAAARAALEHPERSAACAGTTGDGEVAVFVQGAAAAVVRTDDGSEAVLTTAGSMLPVSRTFAGATVTVCLTVDGSLGNLLAAADESLVSDRRFRLDRGVIRGGGLVLTASAAGTAAAPDGMAPSAMVSEAMGSEAMGSEAMVSRAMAPEAIASDFLAPKASAAAADVWTPPAYAVTELGADGSDITQVAAASADPAELPEIWFSAPGDKPGDDRGEQPDQGQIGALGVLLLDDGTEFPLDRDYIIGREPTLDEDARRPATPLRIADPGGTVSRTHLRISLAGGQVKVQDLGSANGSQLHLPTGALELAPHDSAVIVPDTEIGIGNRTLRYLSGSPRRPAPDGSDS